MQNPESFCPLPLTPHLSGLLPCFLLCPPPTPLSFCAENIKVLPEASETRGKPTRVLLRSWTALVGPILLPTLYLNAGILQALSGNPSILFHTSSFIFRGLTSRHTLMLGGLLSPSFSDPTLIFLTVCLDDLKCFRLDLSRAASSLCPLTPDVHGPSRPLPSRLPQGEFLPMCSVQQTLPGVTQAQRT